MTQADSDGPPMDPLAAEAAWRACDVAPEACRVRLDDAALDEIATLADQAMPQSWCPQGLPHLARVMSQVTALLDRGPGVALVETLPLATLGPAAATAIFWLLGQAIARPVAQKWDGTLLYQVRDSGRSFGYGVRGSTTNVELPYHVDNAFGVALPDYVGLLCLRPALSGGVSRFCSIPALHDRLLAEQPALLARLYRPLLWDRQAEHGPDAPKVARAPMFARTAEGLRARVNVSLVRKGYQLARQAIDPEAEAALSALDALTRDPEFWFELPLERGQIQYLNNRSVAHYRSTFADHDQAELKRHLVRSWHRDAGGPDYDG